jgi:hypothetical protein
MIRSGSGNDNWVMTDDGLRRKPNQQPETSNQ